MNTFLRQTAVLAALCLSFDGYSQPEITGPDMLCPESTGTYTTGLYDSYQWYKHDYISGDTVLISGETFQSITIDAYNYVPCWLIVEVSNGPLVMMSEEFFVDGWAFLPPAVMSNGDFEVGDEGQSLLCIGDTMYFELMMPYDTNVVWYRNGNVIPDETNPVLMVTEGGNYNVEGAPSLCPDWVQPVGVTLTVETIDCEEPAGIAENGHVPAAVFPNPASDELTIESPSRAIRSITLHDAAGRIVQRHEVNGVSATIGVATLEKGTYFVTIAYDSATETQPLHIR